MFPLCVGNGSINSTESTSVLKEGADDMAGQSSSVKCRLCDLICGNLPNQ